MGFPEQCSSCGGFGGRGHKCPTLSKSIVGRYGLIFPVRNESLRRALAAKDNICPECSSELDTGWECNNRACQHDAQDEALACTNTDVLLWLVTKNPKPKPRQKHRPE